MSCASTSTWTCKSFGILPDPSALQERPPSLWSTCSGARSWRGNEAESISPRADCRKWNERHNVVDSRRNKSQPSSRRVFFDVLPQLRVRQGSYMDVPLYAVQDCHDDAGAYEDSIKWKWTQYPQFSRPATVSLASSRATLPEVDAQKARASAPDSSEVHRKVAFAASAPATVPEDAAKIAEIQQRRCSKRHSLKKPRQVKSAISGPPEMVAFVLWCEQKHGHLVNTWRILDSDKNMTLSKAEFTRGIKTMGCPGDGEVLWKLFKANYTTEDETISFIHFVPDLAIDLSRFKHWLEERFNGVKAAFHAFDSDGNHKLSYKEFLHSCERFGMSQRLKDIVHCLFIMIDDGSSVSGRGEITEDELGFLERWKCPAYMWADPDFAAKKEFLKHLLSTNKGNSLIAWRRAVDKDLSMKASYAEFYQAFAKLLRSGLLGTSRGHDNIDLVNRVYITFDPFRSGYISLRRWDPEVYQLVKKFTLWARKEFGKVSLAVPAWEQEPGQGISLKGFRTGTQSLGMTEDQMKLLFTGLSLEGIAVKAGKISLEELFFLDNWDPEKLLGEELAWEKMVGHRFLADGAQKKSLQSQGSMKAAFQWMRTKSRVSLKLDSNDSLDGIGEEHQLE